MQSEAPGSGNSFVEVVHASPLAGKVTSREACATLPTRGVVRITLVQLPISFIGFVGFAGLAIGQGGFL